MNLTDQEKMLLVRSLHVLVDNCRESLAIAEREDTQAYNAIWKLRHDATNLLDKIKKELP